MHTNALALTPYASITGRKNIPVYVLSTSSLMHHQILVFEKLMTVLKGEGTCSTCMFKRTVSW